jgi:hypothetical protein
MFCVSGPIALTTGAVIVSALLPRFTGGPHSHASALE